ncbi:hypothetical protein FOZ63_004039, partial [Perkinsus olseni]
LTEDTWPDAVQLAEDTKGVLRVELTAKSETLLRSSSASTAAATTASAPPLWSPPGALPIATPLKPGVQEARPSVATAAAGDATTTEFMPSRQESVALFTSFYPVWAPPGLQPHRSPQASYPSERAGTVPPPAGSFESERSFTGAPSAPAPASVRSDVGAPPGFPQDQQQQQQQRKSYAPKPILKMYLALNEYGRLTPRIMTSVMANFIPLVVQRISRHTDCLTFGMYHKFYRILPTMKATLEAIQEVPSLQRFAQQLRVVVESGPEVPEMCGMGQWMVNFLKALSQEPFDTEIKILLALAEPWSLVVREDIVTYRDMLDCGEVNITHTGVKCDMCGETPIMGPKF